MNKFVNAIDNMTNTTYTENGAITRKSTNSALLDMFALGGAYRTRSEADCIHLFKKAFDENPSYALKCLFYLRDIRGGQGERRFFRVVMKWLATYDAAAVIRNLDNVAEFGRWDDLYAFVGTPVEKHALKVIKNQLELDVQCKTPSLLAKWLKSENTSSAESCRLGNITRNYLGMSHKQYRKTLSILRERINVLERLMSAGKWDEIEFDKIPSKAGMKYKNAFARRDIIREKYKAFAEDKTTKVNAGALYPYECVAEVFKASQTYWGWGYGGNKIDPTNRAMINKYWENLTDYMHGANFNGIAMVDVSGSMFGRTADAPINVSVSLGLYCAEKAQGPFHNRFLTFSSKPKFVQVSGYDFVDKVERMIAAEWGGSTNIEAAFDTLLDIAVTNHCSQEEIPQNLIIISDMEFDAARGYSMWSSKRAPATETLMEGIKRKWNAVGYKMPKLVFWNVQARQDNIPMRDDGNVSYVSGMSPVLYEQILKGLTAYDLMMNKLNEERYACVR